MALDSILHLGVEAEAESNSKLSESTSNFFFCAGKMRSLRGQLVPEKSFTSLTKWMILMKRIQMMIWTFDKNLIFLS